MASRPRPSLPDPPPGRGLRSRVWLACLASSLLTSVALWWVASRWNPGSATLDPETRWVWLPVIAGGGVLLGLAAALWLDRGIVRQVRVLARGMAGGEPTALRGLPPGWGELGELAERIQELLSRQRQQARTGTEHAQLLSDLSRVRESLERDEGGAPWQSPPLAPGALAAMVAAVERAVTRGRSRVGEAAEGLRGAGNDLGVTLPDARESAEQAERGFVEATALLTTLRELHRLHGDLEQALAGPPGDDGGDALEAYRSSISRALEELIEASGASVALLSEGMLKVHEISDLVQRVANRATLIALEAVAGRLQSEPVPETGDALKVLVRDVRAATDRVAELARDVETDAERANLRMTAVRDRVARALDVPMPAASGAPRLEELRHVLERTREMVQDATRKGEQLSAAGERTSRAAQRLARRLEEAAARLGEGVRAFTGEDLAAGPASGGESSPAARLRLLDRDDAAEEPSDPRERGEHS
ncbi:MAG TPA: hypothetical protein VL332_10975 [Candidatus Saccharimonadaceae bacterium]|nr:hypothetical protein [Candidatus Saccharimonadaceae bacterium]